MLPPGALAARGRATEPPISRPADGWMSASAPLPLPEARNAIRAGPDQSDDQSDDRRVAVDVDPATRAPLERAGLVEDVLGAVALEVSAELHDAPVVVRPALLGAQHLQPHPGRARV